LVVISIDRLKKEKPMKSFNQMTKLMVFLSLFFTISTAQATKSSWGANSSSYSHSPVSIDVVDDRGRALNQYSADSNGYKTQRTYLEAIKGKRYNLRIKNTSNRRIGIVIAVDGRNILSGKKSYLRKNEKMYVLDPYESTNYKGWRTDKNHVNRFYFTSAGDSYSNAWGDRSAMGVIAVAVFDEKQRHYKKYRRNDLSNKSAPSRRGYLAEESTGTGFGREEYSPTIRVNFKAKNKPSYKHFFKYEWRNTLCKRGIVNCDSYENRDNNNRFWPRESNNGYAPYPPNHREWKNRGEEEDYIAGSNNGIFNNW
jgi:hypothetical protein